MTKIFPNGKNEVKSTMNTEYKTIQEVFKRFEKDRHNEDKGRNFNLLQEVFAKTELFDLTRLSIGSFPKYNASHSINEFYIEDKSISDLSLPFEAMFIHIEDRQYMSNGVLINSSTYMFTREYNPTHITGTIYEISNEGRRNLPFTVTLEEIGLDGTVGILSISESDYNKATPKHMLSRFYTPQEVLSLILNTFSCIDSLNNKTIIADVPTVQRTEYYRRKGSPAIKVPNRNIYYVINKNDTKSESTIHFTGTKVISQSFRVRGHWRTLESAESIGKDRQGNRVVKGFTWVTEYVKGDENSLVKKIHIVE
jgi:hypothetical protein